jgi:uncharacterized protein YaaQ
MAKKLEGKTAVITGSTEGIGLATAKLFVKEGAYVFITGRRQKELDEAVKVIGNNVSGVQGDVAKLSDLDRLYDTVFKVKGRIDIVFANADVAESVPFGAVSEEHFDKLFNINVRGTLFTVQKALPPRCPIPYTVTAYPLRVGSLMHATFGVTEAFGPSPMLPLPLLSNDVEGLPAFWTKAKYGKMSIEGRDPVNTETPHYSETGAVDDRKILVTPRNANIPGNLQIRQIDRFD